MRRPGIALLLLALPSVGCGWYFNDDDCVYEGAPAQVLRNPATGQCEAYGGHGGCPDTAPPRGEDDPAPPPVPTQQGLSLALPDWAMCYGPCEALGEEACLEASGCRAIYIDPCPDCELQTELEFHGCWGTAPSGPVQGGGCYDLDAFQCSRHDDCIAIHARAEYCASGAEDPACGIATPFERCAPEPGTPPPPPKCEDIVDERACIESGCDPLYEGNDCHCDDTGCWCNEWVFQSCRSPEGGKEGDPCGGEANLSCGPGLFCDWADNTCGGDDSQGVCAVRPKECPEIYDPVCACDGNTYSSACEARRAGSDVSIWGGCQAPPSMFACGDTFCQDGDEYCQRQVSDVAGYPDEYACLPLPPACSVNDPTCACLANEVCGSWCSEAPGDRFTLTCPGG